MDNIPEPEREQSQPKTIIKIRQRFRPFDQKDNIEKRSLPSMGDQIKTPILLAIGDDVVIPLNISAYSCYGAKKGDYLTPASPRIGYEITGEDTTSITTRIEKLQLLKDELGKPIDPSNARLVLEINAHVKDLNKLGLNAKDKPTGAVQTYKFSEERLAFLNRLRVLALFPEGGTYTASPSELCLRRGEIDFRIFYPIDSTPLATAPEIGDLDEGFPIILPSDLEYLKEIGIEFVLDEQEEKRQ